MIGPAITDIIMPHPSRAEVLTIEAYEVQPGDRLIGCPAVIQGVLFHGNEGRWWLVDDHERCIATKQHGDRFQVIRGGLAADDAPPAGMLRPAGRPNLRLVK